MDHKVLGVHLSSKQHCGGAMGYGVGGWMDGCAVKKSLSDEEVLQVACGLCDVAVSCRHG